MVDDFFFVNELRLILPSFNLLFNYREEIRELEMKVQRERERYKLSTQTLSGGFSAIPMMPINSAVIVFPFVFQPILSNCIIFELVIAKD